MGGHRRDQSDSHVPLRPSADFGIEGTELQVKKELLIVRIVLLTFSIVLLMVTSSDAS